MKKLLLLITALCLLLCSCTNPTAVTNTETGENDDTETNTRTDTAVAADFAESDSEMFTDNDLKPDYTETVTVTLSDNGISCSSDKVRIDGSTLTITGEDTFIISGTLSDGMIIVDAKATDKPRLIFDGVDITSSTSAPVYVLEADKVFITLKEGSENTLTNGGSFTAIDENNIDAVIFSKQDLTLNGSGNLTVTSPAGHGIVSKDDLVLTGGSYTVSCASHGLEANDSVRIVNAAMTVDAGKDGIHAENSDDASLGFVYISSGTFNIEAEGDGISAEVSMQIEGGTFSIVTGGGSINASKQSSDSWGGFMGGGGGRGPMMPTSTTEMTNTEESSTSIKALKSTGDMLINGGTFTIDSADDSVHTNGSVTVNGGSFEIASGDDGFHADETLTITDCTVNVSESYEGLEALDIIVSGGDITLVATDDGLNAAGGTDSSGFGGMRGNDQFGGGRGGMGDMGGMSSSSNGSIVISGGELDITASGDGLDANGTLEITGGNITVCGPNQGDTATLDYDSSATITGGTFIGTGAQGMAQSFSDAKQGIVAVSVGNQTGGTLITLKDESGNVILSYAPELDFSVVILSTPDIVSGDSYTITVGSQSGEITAS